MNKPTKRPIRRAHQIRNHNNDCHTLLPDHAPEAVEGAGQRTLSANECACLLITIDEVGINIVDRFLLSAQRTQMYSRMIIYGQQLKKEFQMNLRIKNNLKTLTCSKYFDRLLRTGYNIQIAILLLIIRMLRVFRGVFFVDRFILDGFVFFAETDVAVCMQFSRVLGELVHRNRGTDLASNFDRSLPVNQRCV